MLMFVWSKIPSLFIVLQNDLLPRNMQNDIKTLNL